MINSKELARAGCSYLGTPYNRMDCQAFWERVLADCGLSMDLGGSNSWYRHILDHGWIGTPEECKARFGRIPQGATLFICEPVSASTPEKFRHDGVGDITHMGIYTALSGSEMIAIAREAGVPDAASYNFGDGALHSSSSRGCVATSKFSGRSISGGWNRVGLFLTRIAYEGVNPEPGPGPSPGPDPSPSPGPSPSPSPDPSPSPGPSPSPSPSPSPGPDPSPSPTPARETARVWSPNGNPVNTRKGPDESYPLSKAGKIPVGDLVEILKRTVNHQDEAWSRITWQDPRGALWVCWIKSCFLQPVEPSPSPAPAPSPSPTGLYVVHIPFLPEYQADALIRLYPGAYKTAESASAG